MTRLPFELPALEQKLPAPVLASEDIRNFLSSRRSTPILTFDRDAPGPDEDVLINIIETGMRVPDHRRLGPWRAIIISGEQREAFDKQLLMRFQEINPAASGADLEKEKHRLMRAPVCVSVVSSPVEDPKQTPVWEQELSAGAVCMNMLYAAHAAGFAAAWLSEWWAFDDKIKSVMGLAPHERIAGNIFIGQSATQLFERPRPDLKSRISHWSGD